MVRARDDDDVDKIAIGQRMRAARERLGLQRADVARRIDSHWHTVQRYEDGVNAPSSTRLLQIAAALGVEPYWLVHGREAPPPAPYAAFTAFLQTQLGAEATSAERSVLARVRFAPGDEPTVPLYQRWLLDLRAEIRRGTPYGTAGALLRSPSTRPPAPSEPPPPADPTPPRTGGRR